MFPNEAACLRLLSRLMMEMNLEWTRRVWLRIEDERDTAAAEAGR